LADFEFDDVKCRSTRHNLIEHFWQGKRINNVAAELDYIGNHRQNLADECVVRQLRQKAGRSTVPYEKAGRARTIPQPQSALGITGQIEPQVQALTAVAGSSPAGAGSGR
jgi:hypothetical protein